jgi:PAS domain S-box-containing protein
MRRADGQYRWFLTRALPLRDDQGRIVRWYGTATDIEDRKGTEEALRQSEEQWRDVFENNPTMYFVVDSAGTVMAVNPFGAQQLGYEVAELVGQPVLRVTLDVDREVVQQNVARCFEQLGRASNWEARQVRKDGEVIWVRETAKAVSRVTGPIVLIACEDITEKKRAEQALEDLAGRLISAQEEERKRIGRELHDHISQRLGVLTIRVDQLRANRGIAPDIGDALDELHLHTREVTDDVHRLSHRLHSSTLDYLGLVPALQKLVSEFAARHDIAIQYVPTSMPPSLPSEVALCLFRVAEESLTNIAKHSKARSAHVHVIGAADGIHLTVEDAGCGFDMAAFGSKAGLGFVSMQERLRVLHGTIHVDSAPSRGTRIEAWVPTN